MGSSLNPYNVNYNKDQGSINIRNEVIYVDISDKFNNQYYINTGFLVENGVLPFTTFYMVEENKDYSVELNIISSYEIEGVDIELDDQVINNDIISERLSMRGVDISQITFYPIQYDASTYTLTIIEEFDITIIESDNFENTIEDNHIVPISREFERILSSMVINLDISERTTDSQPSILYICGGTSLSNSYLQDLIQWRRWQGYKVFTANTSDIGSSFSSVSNYISDAYYNWEFPPEYIVLVGDTGGSYAISHTSASGGDSDYPYTLIEGNDLLPEMFIGRISASSSTDLSNIINKTLAYEKATYIEYTETDWYESSGLVGDPSATGNSAIITNEYIENMLNAHDFDNVETCYGCSYSSWMQNRLEEGILYFNYRGYIGTSGFGSNHINNANNGYMTPFVTFITCSTGDFSGTSLTENFIRAGSISNPKGGVAAIGTATSSTHTVPNNIVDMGIYDGIFSRGIETAGGALVSGKMSLYSTYPQDPSSMTYKFTHWNNLMGDPVLNLWTDTPKVLNVEYSDMINMGTDFLEFNLLDSEISPVSDARVVVYIDENNVYESFTDSNGYASINFDSPIPSDASITILKKNFIPFIGSIAVFNEDMQIEVNHELFYIDDTNPENEEPSNGLANAGEIVDIYLYLENLSSSSIASLDGYISTNSEKIDIIDGDIEINNLLPSVPTILGPIQVFIHEDFISTDNSDLTLTLMDESDGLSDWNFNIPFNILSANIEIDNFSFNESTNPGDIVELIIDFKNNGTDGLNNCSVSASIDNSLLDITSSESFIGNIQPGETLNNVTPIIIELSEDIIDGSIFNLSLTVFNENGFSQDHIMNFSTGIADQHDPLGPDSYGYYIYDWTDVGYSLTPFYDWIEIDPSQGGDGSDLGIADSGNGNGISNSTKYIDLPFIFTFYGEDYDEISVNANGWISFGHSNMESFRNYQLPGAGGPSPMVAAFWDDLKTGGNSKVLKYIDEDYIVIEWLNMLTYQHSDIETFQIILYNSITPTGDDEIKIQYKEFNNTTNGDYSQYTPYHGCYSTVGIENHLGSIGLEYTFDNDYPVAAASIQDQSALFITTRNTTVLTAGDVNQDDEINILDIVMVINHILMLETLDSIGQFVADIDENQVINILDVILMINLILDFQ